jgi:hypothetical protein
VSSLLLFIIALVAPWCVHLAPPRQRPVALVGVVAVLLLFAIFAENPLGKWQLWVGLLVGILSIVGVGTLAPGWARLGRDGGASRRAQRAARRRAASPLDEGREPTGEL